MTMYLEHFGLREAPFRITPHTEFFYSGANRGATLEALLYAVTAGEGLVKVTGEVGSGKTMLCRMLMERLPATVEMIYLAVARLTRAPLARGDIREYVNFRLRAAGYHGPDLFGEEALAIIAEASEGLTRRINIFADKTLLAAFAAGTHSVTADHARAAISDTQIVIERRESPRRVAVAAAFGLAA